MRWVLITLIIILSLSVSAENPEDIKLNSYVNDYAGIFTPQQIAELEQPLKEMYDAQAAQMSVVTVNNLGGRDIESFALNVAQGNLGDENNNGLLLLIAIEDQKYRFEVGRGLEPILNDAKVGRFGRDYIVPNFQAGDYATGTLLAIKAVQAEVMEGYTAPPTPKPTRVSKISPFMIFFILMIIFSVIGGSKKRRKTNNLFLAAWMASSMMRGPRGGGGFGGGGFGGFGGGSFGGGGAGGGW